jgi:hypothetical protein
VLVTFTRGTGTVVPVLPGFRSIITFDEQRQAVDDISFEPSEYSPLWESFRPRRQRIREFRSVAAACALRGVFQVRDRSVGALEDRAGYGGTIDPSTALYVAYAWAGLCVNADVEPLRQAVRTATQCGFYDLELLAGELTDTKANSGTPVVPFGPMFSQAWDLLEGLRVDHVDMFTALKPTMRNSLWTVFNPPGVKLARSALTQLR